MQSIRSRNRQRTMVNDGREDVMPMFRSKPAMIEAEQFFEEQRLPFSVEGACCLDGDDWYIVTAHGQKTVIQNGDWIIREPDGRGFYPCKPDIFKKIWERLP
jgi:hypothetical protein